MFEQRQPIGTPGEWGAAMRRLSLAREAEAEPIPAGAGHDAEWCLRGCDVSEAESALLAMPAPDTAALRWKLEHLLSPEVDGWTPGHHERAVRQTLADIARLLPAAA